MSNKYVENFVIIVTLQSENSNNNAQLILLNAPTIYQQFFSQKCMKKMNSVKEHVTLIQ